MRAETIIKRFRKQRSRVPEIGERHVVCDWIRDETDNTVVDMTRYSQLLTLLPDKVVENLERARLSREGRHPILRAGLGYVELLGSIIVDGTAIASSSSEARLVPATYLPPNYLQPGGIPGRTLRGQLRGRVTTLTTAATMTFRLRGEATDVITGTAWAASGAIVMDTVVQTATMWEVECGLTVRSVGTAGTVFAMGDCDMAPAAVTIASQTNKFLGSAGSATPAAVTKDMTTATFLNWTGTWSLATAYSIQTHRYMLEALN